MIFVLDNYDSFVYNLAQYLGELGQEPVVERNDRITVEQIRDMKPSAIVISPGPGRPADAGFSIPLILELGETVPILGVCLGHQAIGEAFGGTVSRAGVPRHGKTSPVHHDGRTIFTGIESPMTATRYHSLLVEREGLPECLEVSAWTEDGLIMGLRHKAWPLEGVQFHPESILTSEGKRMMGNFLQLVATYTW